MIDKEIVALYVRVSTQEQAREGYSIEEQKDKLIKYAEAITFADNEWKGMVKADQDKTVAFYVLRSVNPDPESVDHFDGDIVKSYN